MMKPYIIALTGVLLCVSGFSQSGLINPDNINIPYKKYVLPNGLRLIVHEDQKSADSGGKHLVSRRIKK